MTERRAAATTPYDDATADVHERSGIGARVGFGERPAVLVVDLQYGFTDAGSGVGGDLDLVVGATAELVASARAAGVPVAYTAVGFHPTERDRLTWLRKMPGLGVLVEGTRWCRIDDRVAPAGDEPVWIKRASSAFCGTPAMQFLLAQGVDTAILAGCVTSGCIRATAVDAISAGFHVAVPRECVGDRTPALHNRSLFDIDAKYGDVMALREIVEWLQNRARA